MSKAFVSYMLQVRPEGSNVPYMWVPGQAFLDDVPEINCKEDVETLEIVVRMQAADTWLEFDIGMAKLLNWQRFEGVN